MASKASKVSEKLAGRGASVRERVAQEHERAKAPAKGDGERARALCRRLGRPSKITEDLIYGIAEMVLAGNYRDVAARAHGISRMTLHNWLAKGQELEDMPPEQLDETQQLYVEFLYVTSVAAAHAEAEILADWRKGEAGWQAYATLLERRWPERWKRRDEREHKGEVSARVSLSPEQAAEELRAFGMAAAEAVAAGPDSVPPPEDA